MKTFCFYLLILSFAASAMGRPIPNPGFSSQNEVQQNLANHPGVELDGLTYTRDDLPLSDGVNYTDSPTPMGEAEIDKIQKTWWEEKLRLHRLYPEEFQHPEDYADYDSPQDIKEDYDYSHPESTLDDDKAPIKAPKEPGPSTAPPEPGPSAMSQKLKPITVVPEPGPSTIAPGNKSGGILSLFRLIKGNYSDSKPTEDPNLQSEEIQKAYWTKMLRLHFYPEEADDYYDPENKTGSILPSFGSKKDDKTRGIFSKFGSKDDESESKSDDNPVMPMFGSKDDESESKSDDNPVMQMFGSMDELKPESNAQDEAKAEVKGSDKSGGILSMFGSKTSEDDSNIAKPKSSDGVWNLNAPKLPPASTKLASPQIWLIVAVCFVYFVVIIIVHILCSCVHFCLIA